MKSFLLKGLLAAVVMVAYTLTAHGQTTVSKPNKETTGTKQGKVDVSDKTGGTKTTTTTTTANKGEKAGRGDDKVAKNTRNSDKLNKTARNKAPKTTRNKAPKTTRNKAIDNTRAKSNDNTRVKGNDNTRNKPAAGDVRTKTQDKTRGES